MYVTPSLQNSEARWSVSVSIEERSTSHIAACLQDLVIQSQVKDASDAKRSLSDSAEDFDAGLVKAVDAHDLSRALGLPEDARRQVFAAVVENFDTLNNATDSAMRIYTKTKRFKLVNDNQSAVSVKRARGEDEKTAQVDNGEPKAKVAKSSTSGRKVFVSEVRTLVDGVVDRFGVVVGELVQEIQRLNEQILEMKKERDVSGGEVGSGIECASGSNCS